MGFGFRRRVYESLPVWLQWAACCVPFGLMAGKKYRQVLGRGQMIDRLSREEVLALQSSALGEVLRFCVDQVPVYRHLDSVVRRLEPFEALKAFPLIDKDALQANLPSYLPRDFDRIPHYESTTGGTSGNQLKFYVDDASQSVEMAFMHRQWARVGYTPHNRKATFRGVPFGQLPEGVYWKPNPVYNEMQFSPYHLSPVTIPAYMQELDRYRPQFLHGYPSAISFLAEGIRSSEPKFGRTLGIRAALLGSEGATDQQRRLIEDVFGCRVFTWYGHSERAILAGECESGGTYHSFPDYGFLEIVDESDCVVTQDGARGEIVGTGFLNRSLPLIRYRTGDWARLREPRCACGRLWERFDAVQGRWVQEFVIGASGARISLAALNVHGHVFDRVLRYQFVQDRPGFLAINLMTAPGFSAGDIACVRSLFADKIGAELTVEPVVVENVPLTGRGKVKRLVSRLNSEAMVSAGGLAGTSCET